MRNCINKSYHLVRAAYVHPPLSSSEPCGGHAHMDPTITPALLPSRPGRLLTPHLIYRGQKKKKVIIISDYTFLSIS